MKRRLVFSFLYVFFLSIANIYTGRLYLTSLQLVSCHSHKIATNFIFLQFSFYILEVLNPFWYLAKPCSAYAGARRVNAALQTTLKFAAI